MILKPSGLYWNKDSTVIKLELISLFTLLLLWNSPPGSLLSLVIINSWVAEGIILLLLVQICIYYKFWKKTNNFHSRLEYQREKIIICRVITNFLSLKVEYLTTCWALFSDNVPLKGSMSPQNWLTSVFLLNWPSNILCVHVYGCLNTKVWHFSLWLIMMDPCFTPVLILL